MTRPLSEFFEVGFHGDLYLLDLVAATARRSVQFIETGANVGSTLCYFAKTYPNVQCYSCEPDAAACKFAQNKASPFRNARIDHLPSPDFLRKLAADDPAIVTRPGTIFWLDSHGYGFRWPLREEVEFVTHKFSGAYLFIDDFKVPGESQFLFDEYDGQVCSFETIDTSLKAGVAYQIYYPRYCDKTSKHHPLKGWVLIEFGQGAPLEIPPGLRDKISTRSYVR